MKWAVVFTALLAAVLVAPSLQWDHPWDDREATKEEHNIISFTFYTTEELLYMCRVCIDNDGTNNAIMANETCTLVWSEHIIEDEFNVEGEYHNESCANFNITGHTFFGKAHEYEMYVYISEEVVVLHGRANANLTDPGQLAAISVQTITEQIFRITGLENYDGCFPTNINDVCYTDQPNLASSRTKCNTANNTLNCSGVCPDVQVCNEGSEPSVKDPPTTGTGATINYLKYPTVDIGNATVSVTYVDSTAIEVVFYNGTGVPGAYSCYIDDSENICSLEDFTKSDKMYNMTFVNVDATNISTTYVETVFQDMNLLPYYDQPYIEFAFANFYEGKVYNAELQYVGRDDLYPVDTTTIDCNGVSPGSYCFGFLNPGDSYEEGYAVNVILKFDDGSNVVVAQDGSDLFTTTTTPIDVTPVIT